MPSRVWRETATAASTALRSTMARSAVRADRSKAIPTTPFPYPTHPSSLYLPPLSALNLPAIEPRTHWIHHHPYPLLPPSPLHQTWLVYLSSPLAMWQDGATLVADAPFTGTMRVALLPGSSPQDEEVLLDAHVPTVPLGGSAQVGAFRIKYTWRTQQWRELANGFSCSHCQAVAMEGAVWRLNVPKRPSTWCAGPLTSDAQLLDELRASLKQDVAALPPLSSISTYSFNKVAARAARLALIVKQVRDDDSPAVVLSPLRTALSAWLDGTFPGNCLLYDPTWGGVVSEAGSRDQGAEFGAAMYNDHHFHYGYFIYATATVAKFDPAWRDRYRAPLKDLMADYMSPQRVRD
ncbi:unnamed protein product [Closterium sp. NIES-53]